MDTFLSKLFPFIVVRFYCYRVSNCKKKKKTLTFGHFGHTKDATYKICANKLFLSYKNAGLTNSNVGLN